MTRQISEVRIGDVYPKKGGIKSKDRYWVVVRITDRGRTAQVFSVHKDGTVENGCCYGVHAFQNMQPIGNCPALSVPIKFPLKLFDEVSRAS